MKNYTDLKAAAFKNKNVKKTYDELGADFALMEMLIEQRLKRGLTQQQLAKKVRTKQPVISRLERGSFNPTIKFLNRVADALGAKLHITIS